MENATMAIPEPQWARFEDLKPGDTVELHGFDCAQGTVTIEEDIRGQLYFNCIAGKHYVIGQLDPDGYLIGITIRPAAQIIPITTQERTPMSDFNPDDANAVSRFFQGIADKVVLASTLPKEVAELREAVDKLKQDVDSYREHNARMDEEIRNLRNERQALQDENAQLRSSLERAQTDHGVAETRWGQACSERDKWHNDYISLSQSHEDIKRERDDAQMKIMELEDVRENQRMLIEQVTRERDELSSKLSSIRTALA